MENVIFIIIFGLFLLVNALIKKATSSKKQDKKTQPQGSSTKQDNDEYRASPSDLQKFLQEAKQEQQSKSQQQSRKRRSRESRSGQTSAHWASEEETKKKTEKAKKIRQKHKKSQKEETQDRDQSAKESADQSKPTQKQKYTAPALPGRAQGRQQSHFNLDTDQLANAVIWSEILRPPVSLRSETQEQRDDIMSR